MIGLVVVLNLLAFLLYSCAFIIIIRFVLQKKLAIGTGMFAAAAVITALFVSVSNSLEHSGTTDIFDDYEGFARDLFVLFILIFLYIDSMHREQARRERDQIQIQNDLRVKALLLTEIHHRVNNNLQIVLGLLELQGTAGSERPLAEALKITQNRIQSIAKVHQIIYDSNNLIRVGAEAILDSVIRNLERTYSGDKDRIRVVRNLDSRIYLDLDRAMPLGLILNELLTNSFLHAFPEGKKGEILVELRKDAGNIILSVSDPGRTGEDAILQGRKKGIGMNLVDILVQQIRGKIGFQFGSGTEIRISLPEIESPDKDSFLH